MERAKRLELDGENSQVSAEPCCCIIAIEANSPGHTLGREPAEPATDDDAPRPSASADDKNVSANSLLTLDDQEHLRQIAEAWSGLKPELRAAVLAICRSR